MAKRKTPKVANLRPEKISENQLQKVQSAISAANQIKLEIGNICSQKQYLLESLKSVNDSIKLINEDLEKEYGKFDLDIKTGQIIYPQDGQANS